MVARNHTSTMHIQGQLPKDKNVLCFYMLLVLLRTTGYLATMAKTLMIIIMIIILMIIKQGQALKNWVEGLCDEAYYP